MKKTLFLAGAIILAVPAIAQNGFYLSPSVGAGMSNARPYNPWTDISLSSSFSYNASMGVGYHYKNWRIQSGIQYLTSGYQLNNVSVTEFFDPLNPYRGTDKYRISYRHLGVPLQIGYTILPTKKLSLVPYLGAFISYNIGARSVSTEADIKTKTSWSKDEFDLFYKSISVWGTAALYLQYKATNRISILCGPSAKYMISNFAKQRFGIMEKLSKQKNQAVTLDLGVNIKL
jgi:hypothetical protein